MTAAAIIVAAGSGQRFGNAGKSFAPVLGKPMAWWSLIAAAEARSIDELVLVCGTHSLDIATELLDSLPREKPISLVIGGARRQDSALAGLAATKSTASIIAIHDAARPLVTSAMFNAAVQAAADHGAAVVAAPVADTIKRVADDRVIETLLRDELVSVQTPQAFQKQLLLDAFAAADHAGRTVTDEATLIEDSGGTVVVVPGSSSNMKVTYPDDLVLVEALMRQRVR
jgi:2-C-methyl-D-erythritol 4-phosphate cytidylyltransferase